MRHNINGEYWDVRLVKRLHNDDWGRCNYEQRKVRIKKALRGFDMLGAAIHEGLHVVFPQMSEEAILEAEAALVKVLKTKPIWERITDG